MASAFWHNTIYYVVLGCITIAELIFLLCKAPDRKRVLALFLSIAGLTFYIEAVICCFLKAYNYYPIFFPASPMDDTLAGNLFSQYSIAATAGILALFNLKYRWTAILTFLYVLIEELFMWLGIYEQYWYPTWLTLIGVPVIFWFTKMVYRKNLHLRKPVWRYVFMTAGLFSLHMPAVFWVMKINGIVAPNKALLPDAMHSYALISLLNLFVVMGICMYTYFSNIRWLFKAALTMLLYGVLYAGFAIKLYSVKDGMFLIFATINIFGMYGCIYIMDKLTTPSSTQETKNKTQM